MTSTSVMGVVVKSGSGTSHVVGFDDNGHVVIDVRAEHGTIARVWPRGQSPAWLANAIGRVFDREDRRLRENGYTSNGPQVHLFDLFARRVAGARRGTANKWEFEAGEKLAQAILDELR